MLLVKRVPFTLVIFAILAISGCASSVDKQEVINYSKSDKDYLALKQTIINRAADATTFDRILDVYPLSSFYDPKSDVEPAGKLLTEQYMQLGDYVACLDLAANMLAANYTSLTGHYAASECARLNGDNSTSNYHTWVLDNFIEGIWRTGDGQSPESAFVINSSSDLYAFIQLHQLMAVSQDLVYVKQMPVQKIRIHTPESNRVTTWYFNVTPAFRRGLINQIEAR